MAAADQEYRRLPGRGVRRSRSWITAVRPVCTLWEGRDHLLGVDSLGGYAEDYKRFYYRDIQAIVIRKTDGFVIGLLTLGLLALVPALLAWTVDAYAWRIFWLFLAALFLALLGLHALLGPTCVCHLRTAVQTDQLPSLGRLRKARKVIARLRPLIEQAQGSLSTELLRASPAPPAEASMGASAPAAGTPAAAPLAPPAAPAVALPGPPYAGGAHRVLCALFWAEVVRIGIDFVVDHLWVAAVEVVLTCAISLCLVLALIKQQQPGTRPGLRRWAWASFAYVLSSFVIGYVNFILLAFRQGPESGPLTDFDLLSLYARQSPFESTWLLVTLAYSLAVSVALAASGALVVRRVRPPPAPALPPRPPGGD